TLASTDAQPSWLVSRPEYSTRLRSNRWILHHAWAVTADDRVTALALWDCAQGDGPGAVADLVTHARKMGTDVRILDTRKIFGPLEPAPGDADRAPGADAAADHGQDGEAETGDQVLDLVWRYHQQWSKAAGIAAKRLNRWR